MISESKTPNHKFEIGKLYNDYIENKCNNYEVNLFIVEKDDYDRLKSSYEQYLKQKDDVVNRRFRNHIMSKNLTRDLALSYSEDKLAPKKMKTNEKCLLEDVKKAFYTVGNITISKKQRKKSEVDKSVNNPIPSKENYDYMSDIKK